LCIGLSVRIFVRVVDALAVSFAVRWCGVAVVVRATIAALASAATVATIMDIALWRNLGFSL
jgi:hypothetical protein